ncbi:CBS domain-containing protein [Candidatus Micrarchaeota archaeon]|nr:CBS domain-containing protein [Candidatus Micrarchaeota archaeon]
MKEEVIVKDVMTRGVIAVNAKDAVSKAAKALKSNAIGSVVVLDKGKAVGIVTERDIVFKVVAAGKDSKKLKVAQIMGAPLKVISLSAGIQEAALTLRAHKIKRLPVVDKKGKLVGIITEEDLLRVYPGLIDVVNELSEIRKFGPSEVFTGVCDKCAIYSEALKRSRGLLLCEECQEEDES